MYVLMIEDEGSNLYLYCDEGNLFVDLYTCISINPVVENNTWFYKYWGGGTCNIVIVFNFVCFKMVHALIFLVFMY